MAYFKCGSGGSSIEIDGVAYDGDLKLVCRIQNIKLPDLPIGVNYTSTSVVIYKDEIHILGGMSYSNTFNNEYKHYKFNEKLYEWEFVSNLPSRSKMPTAVVVDDEIHLFGVDSDTSYKSHYKFDGTAWTLVSTMPVGSPLSAVKFGNYVYLVCFSSSNQKIYRYDISANTWTKMGNNAPVLTHDAIVFKNKVYITSYSSDALYVTSNFDVWTQVGTLPYAYPGTIVTDDNSIHLIGNRTRTLEAISSSYNDYLYTESKKHYTFDGTDWNEQDDLPYICYMSEAVTKNGDVYLLGGDVETYRDDGYSMRQHLDDRSNFYMLNKRNYELIQ